MATLDNVTPLGMPMNDDALLWIERRTTGRQGTHEPLPTSVEALSLHVGVQDPVGMVQHEGRRVVADVHSIAPNLHLRQFLASREERARQEAHSRASICGVGIHMLKRAQVGEVGIRAISVEIS